MLQTAAIARKVTRVTSLLIGLTFLVYGNATIVLGLNSLSDTVPFNVTGLAYLIVSILHPKLQSKAYVVSLILGVALILSLDASEFARIISLQLPRLVAEAFTIYLLLAFNIAFSVGGLTVARRNNY